MPYKFVPDSFHTGVTAEALRAKIDNFAPTRSIWSKILGTRGRPPPPIIFARIVRPMNALQLCRWQFSHKETTPFGVLRGNVGRSSWARWKARSRLPISVNWTFFARCYGWGATSNYRLKIGDFAPTGAGWPKISGRRGRPHQPFFFSEN